jgi:hypothetical protein
MSTAENLAIGNADPDAAADSTGGDPTRVPATVLVSERTAASPLHFLSFLVSVAVGVQS